jgi:hypothetical protein
MHVADYGYGVIGCSEFDVVLDSIEAALAEAERIGITNTTAYASAKKFYDDQTGFWTKHWVQLGSFCVNMVAEAKGLLTTLNAAIALGGGTQLAVPKMEPQTMLPDLLGQAGKTISDVKWIVVAGAAVAGLYVFGPAIKAALGMRAARS